MYFLGVYNYVFLMRLYAFLFIYYKYKLLT